MSEKRFTYITRLITDKKAYYKYYILDKETLLNTEQVVGILNAQNDYIDYITKERNLACNKLDKLNDENKTLKKENEQLKNELRKEKSLREYSDSMIDVDLIVNIRFSNGEWKADVSVIDDE